MEIISINSQYREVKWNYTTEDGNTLPIIFREWFNPREYKPSLMITLQSATATKILAQWWSRRLDLAQCF